MPSRHLPTRRGALLIAVLCAVGPHLARAESSKPPETITVGPAIPLSMEQLRAIAAKSKDALPAPVATPTKIVVAPPAPSAFAPLDAQAFAALMASKRLSWTSPNASLGPIPRPAWRSLAPKPPDITIMRAAPAAATRQNTGGAR
jgi:hypothetical protein